MASTRKTNIRQERGWEGHSPRRDAEPRPTRRKRQPQRPCSMTAKRLYVTPATRPCNQVKSFYIAIGREKSRDIYLLVLTHEVRPRAALGYHSQNNHTHCSAAHPGRALQHEKLELPHAIRHLRRPDDLRDCRCASAEDYPVQRGVKPAHSWDVNAGKYCSISTDQGKDPSA